MYFHLNVVCFTMSRRQHNNAIYDVLSRSVWPTIDLEPGRKLISTRHGVDVALSTSGESP